MMDFRRLRYFVAVYEEGSISRAAERENVAQPALSVHIRQLEAEMSVRLFERSAQGVQATPAGRHFYKLCNGLLRDLASARQEMLDFGGTIAGAIRVGLMPTICRGPLAKILVDYTSAYPKVEIEIVEAYSGTLADRVVAGELDLAVCNRPAPQTNLTMRLLFSDRVLLVSGAARPRQPWVPCRLDAIDGLKLVLPSAHHSLRRILDRQIKAGTIRPARVIEVDGLGATMEFVGESDWSTMLPSAAVIKDRSSGRFILNPIASPHLTSDIYVMHRPDQPLSLPAQRIVQMIHAELLAVPGKYGL
ncbi:LysR family transcriptional regulator [Allostella humosa]|nr:LysR family transcriptional regulator [Stella humosa]